MVTVRFRLFFSMLLLIIGVNVYPLNRVHAEDLRKYADPITENILLAMNENNYEKYTEHFDQQMKNALPESQFREVNALIKGKIGKYISKQFLNPDTIGSYKVFYYEAKFDQEAYDVLVKVVFSENDGKLLVSGFWLDSPNLRK